MKTTRNIFWGLVLKPGKRYETEVQEAFRVTKACVEPSSAGGKVSSVIVECDNSEEFIIANLGPKLYNETLDLAFNEGEKICFKVDGPGTIHLSGNILEENSPPDDSSMFDMGSESSEGEEEESESEVEAGDKIKEVTSEDEKLAKKALKRKKDDQQAGPGKKPKLDAEEMDTTADTTLGDLDDTDNFAEENDSEEEDDDSDDGEDEGETTADPVDTTTDVTVASDDEDSDDDEDDSDEEEETTETTADPVDTTTDVTVASDDSDDSDEEEETVETKKVETLEHIKETIEQNGETPKKSKICTELEVAPKEEVKDKEEVKEKEAELPKTPKEVKSKKEPKTPKEEEVKAVKLPETPIIEKPTESKIPKEKKAKKEVNTPKPEAKTPKPDAKKREVKTPKPEVKASNEETKNLKAEPKTPKQEAKTPKAETKTPKQEAKTPKGESKTPKQDVKTPKQESKTPKSTETPGKTPKRTLKGNVTIEDLKEGTGPEAKAGNIVGMYYAGRLKNNNKQFDATLTGKPFKFKLGSGQVIKGWDVGVLGMKVGGKRKLTIPAAMAYGSQGAPPDIAPNADLVFDIECKFVK